MFSFSKHIFFEEQKSPYYRGSVDLKKNSALKTFFKNLLALRIFYYQDFFKISEYEKINISGPGKSSSRKKSLNARF